MITFSKLEKKGHLGNQLFQIASTMGIAIKNNHEFCFPKWSYNDHFKTALPLSKGLEWISYQEKQFHYEPIQFDAENYDLEGWLQSEKYFDIEKTKNYFQFENGLLNNIRNKYKEAFAKKTILISVRRGDFVDHPDYFQLPIQYYILALTSYFSDWEESNLIVLSDDIAYCKFHFSFLNNVFFADDLSAIEQLALGSLCDDFIISNSTFSWWCAWLGEKKNSKVVRPLHYFTASKRKKDDDKDYFPDRWLVFNHLNLKIDLNNTCIALTKDNLFLERYLHHNFNFKNENAITKLDRNNILDLKIKEPILIINDCVLPPFIIYCTYTNSENCIGYVKGNLLNISQYFDGKLFQKQFDFGLFASILNKKNYPKKTKHICFVLLKNKGQEQDNHSIWKEYSRGFDFEKSGFMIFYSFAGKVKGWMEFKYYFAVQTRQLKVKVKTKIKRIIRPKK